MKLSARYASTTPAQTPARAHFQIFNHLHGLRHKHKPKPIYTAAQKRHREQLFLLAVLSILVIITLIATALVVWRARKRPTKSRNEIEREKGGFWEKSDIERARARAPRVEIMQVDGGEAVWVWDWEGADQGARTEPEVEVDEVRVRDFGDRDERR